MYQGFVRTEGEYRPEHVFYTDTGGDGRQTLGPNGKVILFPAMFTHFQTELGVPSSTDLHHLKCQVHLQGAGVSCSQLFKSHSQNMYTPWRPWKPQAGCAVLPLQPFKTIKEIKLHPRQFPQLHPSISICCVS